MPTETKQTRPLPTPDCIEVVNTDDTLDMATKAIAMLQQKTLTADKKTQIVAVNKTMAETIAAYKTHDSRLHEHPHTECHEAFQIIKQELAEIRISMASKDKTYVQIAAMAPPYSNDPNYIPQATEACGSKEEICRVPDYSLSKRR
jgi:hypothetical protein